MKDNKFKNSKMLHKKWFYLTIAFGIIFAVITTMIAIFKNMQMPKTRKIQQQGFIETGENKPGVIKSPYPYETLDKNFLDPVKEEEINKSTNKNEIKEKEMEQDKETKETEDVDEENEENKNKFIKPVSGTILQKFSNQNLVKWPVLGKYKTHEAIDIKAKKNTPVKACSDGTIDDIKNEEGTWGVCITIKHKNGFKSIYKGLSEQVQVKLDQKVKAGDVIGTIGEQNKIESNLEEHLHFTLLQKDGSSVDPLKYINFE